MRRLTAYMENKTNTRGLDPTPEADSRQVLQALSCELSLSNSTAPIHTPEIRTRNAGTSLIRWRFIFRGPSKWWTQAISEQVIHKLAIKMVSYTLNSSPTFKCIL